MSAHDDKNETWIRVDEDIGHDEENGGNDEFMSIWVWTLLLISFYSYEIRSLRCTRNWISNRPSRQLRGNERN